MARILVVDDDRSVRAAITKILSKNGHEVVEAADGKSALALYRAAPADLVIMDVYMPEMDGIDTTVRLKQEFPDAKVIGMSGGGYADKDEVLDLYATLGADYTIAKPLRQQELVTIVRQALDS